MAILPAACGATAEADLVAAEETWSSAEIDDYSLKLQVSCFCGLNGVHDIEVQDGHSESLTVESLFDIIRQSLNEAKVDVTYGECGHPTSIEIDSGEADGQMQISAELETS